MEFDQPETKAYLTELYSLTEGDTDAQVSMHDVGEPLGLSKEDAGMMAETLFMLGFAELKTLSGGIGITVEGLKALNITVEDDDDGDDLKLGSEAILGSPGLQNVERMVQEIKENLAQTAGVYDSLEEAVIDIKTIELQLLSPSPKTAVVRELLISLHSNLRDSCPEGFVRRLNSLATSS